MAVNPKNFLMGCRFDVWVRLLVKKRGTMKKGAWATALLITVTSLVLFPFALLERLILAIPIACTKVERDPVYVIGHWRMGTTFLQNAMTRDKQFGWFGPIDTIMVNNSRLLGWLFRPVMRKLLVDARPMDNLDYRVDLPIEEVFALAEMSTHAATHMLTFSHDCEEHLAYLFVDDMDEKDRREYFRKYSYIIRKQTLHEKGRRLLLKSPDNTCRTKALRSLYPDARFVHIHRDPYTTVLSTIHMFNKQFGLHSLQELPNRTFVEDAIIANFVRVYQSYFADVDSMTAGHVVEVEYEDFATDPLGQLERIYEELALEGFDAARADVEAYIASLGDYKRNEFVLDPDLQRRIEENLGFYFDHYGYRRRPSTHAQSEDAACEGESSPATRDGEVA